MSGTAMLGRIPVDGLSHVRGDTEDDLWELTIPQVVRQAAEQWPDTEAVVFLESGDRPTFRELAEEVDEVARGLLELGITTGDRVGVWSPNRYEWVLGQFATARIGAILVCINPAYKEHELEYALTKVGCRALITAPSFKTSDYVGILQSLCPELEDARDGVLESARVPSLRTVICMGPDTPPGMVSFDAIRRRGVGGSAAVLDGISDSLDPFSAINIQFTSGTTGSPKGATLTHHNIVNNGRLSVARMGCGPGDRICAPVPLYHCFGMVLGTLGGVSTGATVVFPGEAFEPGTTLAAAADESCTAMYGVPTMFVGQLAAADFDSHDLSSLRTGMIGGAPCPMEVMKDVQTRMHLPDVTVIYGMTETSPLSFQTEPEDPVEKRVATVGRVHPHVESRIVDLDGNTVPVGEQGEILTRGYSVMLGYWNDEERTAEAIDTDGWMHTGDLGRMDEEGFVSITGRIKDMIIRGGENIYPREIEELLFTLDGVEQAQVFGVPDEKFGEIVCAWIVASDDGGLDADRVRRFCADRLAYFKVPAHVRFVEQLPLTATGKPQKFVMSRSMAEELAGDAG